MANEKPTTEIFVNQTVIPFKKTCDFCEETRVFSLPEMHDDGALGTGDFRDSWDLEVHRHVKRRNHIRTQIPTSPRAGSRAQDHGLFKYLLARKVLVAKCRLEFQRFFDPPTKTYFYFRRVDPVLTGPRRRVAAMRVRGPEVRAWGPARNAAPLTTLAPRARLSRARSARAAPTNAHRRGEREQPSPQETNAGAENQTQVHVLAQAPLPQGGGALPFLSTAAASRLPGAEHLASDRFTADAAMRRRGR